MKGVKLMERIRTDYSILVFLLSLWNPLLSSYRGVSYQLISISIYSSLYFVVMKKREWRA